MGSAAVVAINILYLKIAREIQQVFLEKSIPVVFLKGISLLETAYPDLQARFMGDIDILVPRKFLLQAHHILHEMGFISENTLEFLKPGKIPVQIDLHYMLWYFDERKIWKTVQRKDMTKDSILILSPEDNFLHLILHSILQDGLISANSLEDGRRLLNYYHSRWDWNIFFSRVKNKGWGRVVDFYLQEFSRKNPSLMPQGFIETNMNVDFILRLLKENNSSYERMIVAQEKWREKIRLFREIFFPPFSFLKIRYPNCPKWLLFLARFLILMRKKWPNSRKKQGLYDKIFYSCGPKN